MKFVTTVKIGDSWGTSSKLGKIGLVGEHRVSWVISGVVETIV